MNRYDFHQYRPGDVLMGGAQLRRAQPAPACSLRCQDFAQELVCLASSRTVLRHPKNVLFRIDISNVEMERERQREKEKEKERPDAASTSPLDIESTFQQGCISNTLLSFLRCQSPADAEHNQSGISFIVIDLPLAFCYFAEQLKSCEVLVFGSSSTAFGKPARNLSYFLDKVKVNRRFLTLIQIVSETCHRI